MLSEKRQEDILKYVDEKRSVTVQELKEVFDASESTIRRDITYLDKEGKLVKVFGGALSLDSAFSSNDIARGQREEVNREEKVRIAKIAAQLIEPGDYVFIDTGTTTGFMIDFIREKEATYVTNAVYHARRLVAKGFHVILLGGELKEETDAVVGADTVLHIQKYHFNKGFFGANGVSLNAYFTTDDIREALIKRIAVENTFPGNRYILADHEKFGRISSVTFTEFPGTVVLTDKRPDSSYMSKIEIRVV
ncbi:MAG: DeoR/GlpR transcriptional regulator [Eubacterium sp.]|nr:DeoR/GlpR transcriptional regulator [Eubacterium sp.]